eukprot:854835-Prorocentrum_minimum.AAC.1
MDGRGGVGEGVDVDVNVDVRYGATWTLNTRPPTSRPITNTASKPNPATNAPHAPLLELNRPPIPEVQSIPGANSAVA